MSEDKIIRNLLVLVLLFYFIYLLKFYEMVGLDIYVIGGGLNLLFFIIVWVCKEIGKWCEVFSMMVVCKNVFICFVNGKIYVIGGCELGEFECWVEVFDLKI